MKLETAAKYMNAETRTLDPALLTSEVGSFAIDSRDVVEGGVFLALSQPEYRSNGFNGDFEDSTPYVPAAFDNRAVACVVRRERFEEHKALLGTFRDRILFVEDVIVALQRLAHGVYREWGGPVVAITGSAGKTTAKELTAHVLGSGGKKVLRNIKNYNNGLGHPLTVLNLVQDKNYDVAVLEMGMSTPMHEIQRLCQITPPDVAVELNVLPVHLEHLGSIENIAKAKAELVEGMKTGGVAVLNADDRRVAEMHSISKGQVITYGIESDADLRATNIRFAHFGQTRFDLTFQGQQASVLLPLNGKHNILNALAAAAVGLTFGMTLEEIAGRLKTVAPPPQRGEVLSLGDGCTVINDSYNSNPDALIAMAETLVKGSPEAKRRVVIAGEMLELGPDAKVMHESAGRKLASLPIDILIGVRGLAAALVQGAKEAGLSDARFVADAEAAADLAVSLAAPGDAILVKGSRGVRTEKVIERLLERFPVEESKGATQSQN